MSTSLPFGTAARPVSLDFDIELTELPPQPILAAPPAQDGRAALTQEDAALNRLFRRGGRTRPAPVAVPATPTVPPVLTPLPAAAPPTLTPLAPPVLSEPRTPSQPPILSAPSAVTSDEAEREQEMLSLELELPDFDFAPSPTPPTLEVLPPAASPELATLLAGVGTLTTHWAAIVAGSANHYGVLRDGLSLLVARVGALPNRTPQDGGLTTLVDALIHCVDQLRVSGPNPREAEAVRTALATLAATLPHAPRWLPADAARWQADTLMLQQAASPVLRTVPMVSEYAPPTAPADATPAMPTLTAAPLLEAAAVAAASVAAAPLLVAEPVAAQPEAALDFPFDFDGVDALRMEAAPEATPVAVPPVMTVIPTLATEPVSPTLTAAPVAEVAEVTAQTAAAAPIAPLLVAEPVAAQPEATLDFPFDFDGVEAAAEAEPAPPALVAAPPILATASAAAPTAQPEPVAPAPAVPTLTATPLLTAEPKEIEAPAAAVNPFPFAFDEAELPAVPLALDPAEASPEAALPVLATAEPARSTLTAAPIAEIEMPAPVPPVVEAYTAAMASDARLGFDYAAPPRTPWGFASPEATVVTEPVPPVLAVTPAEVVEVPAAAPQPTAPAEDMFAALVHAVAEEAEDAAPVAEAVPMVATQEAEAAAMPTLSALDRLLSGAMPALEADAEPAPESEPEPAPPAAPLDDWVMPSLDALDTPPDADRDALLVAAQSLPVAKGVAVEAEEAEADALAEREADDVDETDLSLDFAADSPLELFDTPPQWAELPPPFVSPPAASKAVEASAPLAPALGAAAFLVVEPTSAAESMAAEEAIDPATAWRMAQVLAEAEAEAEVQAEAAALPVAPPPAPPAAPFSGSILVDAIPHVREQHSGDPLGHDLMAQAETWGQPDSYTPSAIPGAILVDDIPLLRRPMRLEEMEKAEEIAAAAAAATKTGSSSVPVTLPPTALAALFGLLNAEAPPPEPGIDRAAFLLQGPSLIQRLTTERIAARLHGIAPGFVTAAEELARCAAEAGYPALAELAAAFAKALAHPRQAERAFEMAIDVIAVLSDGIQLVRANQAPEAAPDLVAALRAGM